MILFKRGDQFRQLGGPFWYSEEQEKAIGEALVGFTLSDTSLANIEIILYCGINPLMPDRQQLKKMLRQAKQRLSAAKDIGSYVLQIDDLWALDESLPNAMGAIEAGLQLEVDWLSEQINSRSPTRQSNQLLNGVAKAAHEAWTVAGGVPNRGPEFKLFFSAVVKPVLEPEKLWTDNLFGNSFRLFQKSHSTPK